MSEFEFSFGSAKQGTPARKRKGVMRILAMANYCGAQDSSAALNNRQPLRVDIDSFSTVMKRLAPTAVVKPNDTTESVRCLSLDDFEPDSLFARLECFDALRQSRKDIKAGKRPSGFEEGTAKGAQKDCDARWTKKNNEVHFGYKDHVKVGADSKIISFNSYCTS